MTIGEAARERFLTLAEQDGVSPYKLVINLGDVHLLDEIRKMAGRPFAKHPLTTRDNMMQRIRRSELFEFRGYSSLPERGRGRIANYGLRRLKRHPTLDKGKEPPST